MLKTEISDKIIVIVTIRVKVQLKIFFSFGPHFQLGHIVASAQAAHSLYMSEVYSG